MKSFRASVLLVVVYLGGCGTPDAPNTEKGPQNTIAYNVPIESNLPGTKIEVNYTVIGTAPVTVKIFGDRDGTFHNFGNDEYTVRAYPPDTNYYPQTKIFKTGAFSIKDDQIPRKIAFNFDPNTDKH
jgi:hypothetical protein